MTSTEFSNEFDVLFENLTTGGNIELDEYEKSICLTKGQEILALEMAQAGDNLNLTKLSRLSEYTTVVTGSYETSKKVTLTAGS